MSKLFQAVFYGASAEEHNSKQGIKDGLFVLFSCLDKTFVIYIPNEVTPYRIFKLSNDDFQSALLIRTIQQNFVQGSTKFLKLV